MNSQRKPSRQELLRRQQQSTFVGREDQLASFRHNLTLPPEDWRFLFNVSGQGGVGKSTLIRQFRKVAEEAGFITAYTSESENSVPEAMGRLAEQLEQQGYKLNQFSERYKVYRQKKQELESDPDAPQGFSAFLGRSLAKAGLGLAKQVPGSGAVTPFLDEETIATQAGEWTSYVARKLGNKDEVRLVQEPVEVLAPLFLQDIGRVVEKGNLTLFFDTYERTSDFLDSWLREILEGRYGDLPINVIVVIAGREELSRNDWADYEGSIARLPLEPFTEDEARQYLTRKGVTNPQVVDVILRLSGCLPLLVATLAVESPNDPDRIGDPSGTAVERFLKWVDDPKRRQVALDAALPLTFNQDIVAVLHGEDTAAAVFSWLKQMPFVEEHSDGWKYHDIARTQMLRYKRLTSPQEWANLHRKLADYYDNLRANLQLGKEKQWLDTTWQGYSLTILYHRLCQTPQQYLPVALNEFCILLKSSMYRKIGLQYAQTISQAGEDLDIPDVQHWGKQLVKALSAYDGLHDYNASFFEGIEEALALLINYPDLETSQRSVVIGLQGELFRFLGRYEDAIENLNQAIKIDPTDFYSIADLADISRLLGNDQEALRGFDHAIALNPKFAWAIAGRGITHCHMGHYEKALQDLNLAIKLNPNDSYAIRDRGYTYLLLNYYDEALRDFNLAIKVNPSVGWHFYFRALAYQALGQTDDSKADLESAINLARQKYETNLGSVLSKFELALFHLAQNKSDQAECFYRNALSRATSFQIREAIFDLESLLAIFPSHKLAKAVKAALERKLAVE